MHPARHRPYLTLAALASCAVVAAGHPALAQSPPPQATTNPAIAAEEDLTLVVGTRFVTASSREMSPKAQFTDARIPLSAFNETDHCIDQSALELAMEYFNSLGPVLGKAGHYHFVPADPIEASASMCEKMHGQPPQAWGDDKTKIIAFGKIVQTSDAPALERSIR